MILHAIAIRPFASCPYKAGTELDSFLSDQARGESRSAKRRQGAREAGNRNGGGGSTNVKTDDIISSPPERCGSHSFPISFHQC